MIFIVADCVEQSDTSDECFDAWNTLVVRADPGMRRAMTAYDRCIEDGGYVPFDRTKCPEEMERLLANFP